MWGEITVGELIETGDAEIVTGPFGTQLKAAEYVQAGWPVINVRNVGFGEVRKDDLEFVDDEKAESLARHRLQAGDIVFGRKGAVERHALISAAESGWVQGSDCIRLRIDPNRFRPMFASYALRTDWHQQWMKNLCSFAATMASLNQDIVRLIELPDVPLRVQDLVIEQLSCFDDLIENNRRRIEILEEMARLLYREWFVHFRFPGHEDVELVDSELGLIPEGWKVSPTGDVFDSVGGGTPSKKEPSYWDNGDIDWFTPSDLTKSGTAFMFRSEDRINGLGLKKSSAKLFPAGSVMMTSRATVGVVAIAACEASTNQGFITCVPNDRVSSEYLYLWLQSQVKSFLQLAGGATFKELRKSDFRDYKLAVPPEALMAKFGQMVRPQFDLVANLIRQNEILREARDLLLPRLVSGELDVSELDLDGVLA